MLYVILIMLITVYKLMELRKVNHIYINMEVYLEDKMLLFVNRLRYY